jgi:hypothetical protein
VAAGRRTLKAEDILHARIYAARMRADSLLPEKNSLLSRKISLFRRKYSLFLAEQGICLQPSEIFGVFCMILAVGRPFSLLFAPNREFFPCSQRFRQPDLTDPGALLLTRKVQSSGGDWNFRAQWVGAAGGQLRMRSVTF